MLRALSQSAAILGVPCPPPPISQMGSLRLQRHLAAAKPSPLTLLPSGVWFFIHPSPSFNQWKAANWPTQHTTAQSHGRPSQSSTRVCPHTCTDQGQKHQPASTQSWEQSTHAHLEQLWRLQGARDTGSPRPHGHTPNSYGGSRAPGTLGVPALMANRGQGLKSHQQENWEKKGSWTLFLGKTMEKHVLHQQVANCAPHLCLQIKFNWNSAMPVHFPGHVHSTCRGEQQHEPSAPQRALRQGHPCSRKGQGWGWGQQLHPRQRAWRSLSTLQTHAHAFRPQARHQFSPPDYTGLWKIICVPGNSLQHCL